MWIVCLITFYLPLLVRRKIWKIVSERDIAQGALGVADPIKTNRCGNSVGKWKGCWWDYKWDSVHVKSCSIGAIPLHWVGGGKVEGLLKFLVPSHFHTVPTAVSRWNVLEDTNSIISGYGILTSFTATWPGSLVLLKVCLVCSHEFMVLLPCSFGLVWLISHGWKYCWLVWYTVHWLISKI